MFQLGFQWPHLDQCFLCLTLLALATWGTGGRLQAAPAWAVWHSSSHISISFLVVFMTISSNPSRPLDPSSYSRVATCWKSHCRHDSKSRLLSCSPCTSPESDIFSILPSSSQIRVFVAQCRFSLISFSPHLSLSLNSVLNGNNFIKKAHFQSLG